jgi:DNA repair protein RadC
LTERPYEKLETHGAESLSDAELLAVLIRSGTRSANSIDVAERLLLAAPDGQGLSFLAGATLPELKRIPGIGRVKAISLQAAVELGRRATRGRMHRAGDRILDPEAVVDGLLDDMRLLPREEMRVILLDIRGCLVRTIRFAEGGISSTVLHPRDVFRDAVRSDASAVILAHNHPSGDPEPSGADIETTRRVAETGAMIGIPVVDHIVVASAGHVSMRRRGLI